MSIELELNEPVFLVLLNLVHRHTGITMSDKKRSLLQGRLRPRLKELQLTSYDEYLHFLESNPQEVQEFINQVTTNETFFFRTPRIWDYFNKTFLPKWHSENPTSTLKAWSAASSTGEEAYTIAMCCQDFKEHYPNFKYQIHGSDISMEGTSSYRPTLTKAADGVRQLSAFKR